MRKNGKISLIKYMMCLFTYDFINRNRFVKPLSATNTDETKTNNTEQAIKVDRTEKKKMLNKKKNLDDNMRKKPAKLKTSLKKNAKKMNGISGKKLGKKIQNNSVSKS